MATATLFDMQLIAQDQTFGNRVKASLYQYCTTTLQSETANNHTARRTYAATVLNNPNSFISDFAWASASNQTLANDVITTGNAGANFTSATTTAQVAAAVTTSTPTTTGATDTDINNAVANAFNALANA